MKKEEVGIQCKGREEEMKLWRNEEKKRRGGDLMQRN